MKETILATFALFFSLMVMAGQIFSAVYERKKRKDEEDAEIRKYDKPNMVRAIIIDSHGFLAVVKDPGDPMQHVFCSRLRTFCSASCQFFASADNCIDQTRPCFDCWMLSQRYIGTSHLDWRNTKPGCAPERKP